MAKDVIPAGSIKLRDYRYPSEVTSLVLTFVILISLYTLDAIFLAIKLEQTDKFIAITLLGLVVYVVTVLVALVKLGNLATIEAGLGAVFFGAVVVLTMLAAESFDPRLIWDRCNTRTP